MTGANFSSSFANPKLAGWPNYNSGWPDVNTTRISDLEVDASGRVIITALGRRVVTTSDAFQKEPSTPTAGASGWADFVRVYTPNLSDVVYSSILRSTWDPTAGDGGNGNTSLTGVVPVNGGVFVVGYHQLNTTTGLSAGTAMPTTNVLSWGDSTADKEDGILAWLRFV
jgi:hypothetical protein